MLEAIGNTITKPWKEQMDWQHLLLWFLVLAIGAWIIYDSLRILSSWVANAAE